MTHHDLDVHPMPKDKPALFVNEPWLNDDFREPGDDKWYDTPDKIRIYVPVDISAKSIMNKLRYITQRYGMATESNEFRFSTEVDRLVFQIEVYDQIWYARGSKDHPGVCRKDEDGLMHGHSREGIELVKQFVEGLKKIPDGCAEQFPFELIVELRKEYLRENKDDIRRELF